MKRWRILFHSCSGNEIRTMLTCSIKGQISSMICCFQMSLFASQSPNSSFIWWGPICSEFLEFSMSLKLQLWHLTSIFFQHFHRKVAAIPSVSFPEQRDYLIVDSSFVMQHLGFFSASPVTGLIQFPLTSSIRFPWLQWGPESDPKLLLTLNIGTESGLCCWVLCRTKQIQNSMSISCKG